MFEPSTGDGEEYDDDAEGMGRDVVTISAVAVSNSNSQPVESVPDIVMQYYLSLLVVALSVISLSPSPAFSGCFFPLPVLGPSFSPIRKSGHPTDRKPGCLLHRSRHAVSR